MFAVAELLSASGTLINSITRSYSRTWHVCLLMNTGSTDAQLSSDLISLQDGAATRAEDEALRRLFISK